MTEPAQSMRSAARAYGPRRPANNSVVPFGLVLAAVLVTAIAMVALPTLTMLVVVGPALLMIPWIWRRPVRGVYLVTAATVVIEQLPLGMPDSLTDRIPIFLNLDNTSSALQGVSIAPIEIIFLLIGAIALARGVEEKTLSRPRGPIVAAYAVYAAVLLFTEIHGLLGGADLKLTLWELRPQAYGAIVFLLTITLVRTRREASILAAILLAGTVLKGVLGTYRYVVTFNRDTSSIDAIMAHEESYFFALFFIAAVCCLIWYRQRRLVLLFLLGSLPVGVALIENKRRAGEAAAMVGIAIVLALGIRYHARLRGRLSAVAAFAGLALASISAASWNSDYGLGAAIVRPIKSQINPTVRDSLSDAYRVGENQDILATFRLNPLIGTGFGHPMQAVAQIADISKFYPLWNYIPHDTMLWIPMRMGVLGFAVFWGLLAMATLSASTHMARSRDPLGSAFAAFCIAALGAEIVVGYTDLQLEAYRNMIFIGLVIGIAHLLPRLFSTDVAQARVGVSPSRPRQ